MYAVYILKSEVADRYYIGSTKDVGKRLAVHNGSQAGWTKRYQPWKVMHVELFGTRGEAVARERKLKRLKNVGKYLEEIVEPK